jgi:D-alanyl-D-alanine-carboxypeptidase/D-alanyl-D-alanine-endopeptidase
MKILALLTVAAGMALSAPAQAQDAAGDWSGTLVVNESLSVPLVVHIRRDDAGALSGTMDSPSQGATGIPLAGVEVADGRLVFTVPAIQGRYEGTWDPAESRWKGQWSQGGGSLPLELAEPPPPPPLPAGWGPPADSEIAALIAARIAPRVGQGLVVGVLEPHGSRVVAGGPQGGEAFGGDTLFEIGSISKVFTALILADMAGKGEVSLDDPAEKYLPEGARMPERGRRITLRDLATHVSGLPRLPDNMPFADPEDPYADYTEAMMLEFLAGYELPRDVGERWEYSNLGVGLLGYLLGRAAGTDYATLLRERITGPLGMADTVIELSPEQYARFAPGHDAYMRPTKPWRLPALAGAGAIRSTVDDMLRFAAAALDPDSPIGPAMRTALSLRTGSGSPRTEQALGWLVMHPEPGREVLMHNGGTGGYRSTLALEPANSTAVVALANSSAEPSATDLALHVLVGSPVAPTPPVPTPPPAPVARTEITLPPAELDRLAGRYDFGGGVVFTITRAGNELRAQREGAVTGPALPIYPETPLSFFWKAVDAQLVFTTDDGGTITGAKFKQGALELSGTRVGP